MVHADPRRSVSYMLRHCNMGVTCMGCAAYKDHFLNTNSLAKSVLCKNFHARAYLENNP